MTNQITYYADNGSMGETSDADCEQYRTWALGQLQSEYPNHDVTVSSEQSTRSVDTDDYENEEAIQLFCHDLWDSCPWDWVV